MNYLHQLIQRHTHTKADRIALFSMITSSSNLLLALIKIGLGLFLSSFWLLIFGGYYLILFSARAFLLKRYTINRAQQSDRLIQLFDGILYVVLGISFTICSFVMFRGGNDTHFNTLTAITVATIGFYKIIVAIIGFIRVKKLNRGSLLLLKVISLADGAVALVLTQFALLSSQHSQSVNKSTGLFGMAVGIAISLLGFILIFFTYRKRKSFDSSSLK